MGFRKVFDLEEATKTRLTETIYASTTPTPPQRWNGATVKELCTIKWDTEIDVVKLPTYTNCLGKVFHVLNFEVEMTSSGSSLDFAVYHDGKRQGSKNVVVDYEV